MWVGGIFKELKAMTTCLSEVELVGEKFKVVSFSCLFRSGLSPSSLALFVTVSGGGQTACPYCALANHAAFVNARPALPYKPVKLGPR